MQLWILSITILLFSTLEASLHASDQKDKSMKIESPVFKNNGKIPQKYTCEGENISPPLTIVNIPDETQSLALIVEDPDAPSGTFDHWIAWNISPTQHILDENVVLKLQGVNSYGENKYRGPCPPPGKPHRYFFILFALNKVLSLPVGATKVALIKEMEGHILEKAELIGIFQRK